MTILYNRLAHAVGLEKAILLGMIINISWLKIKSQITFEKLPGNQMATSIKIGKVYKTLQQGLFGFSVWTGETGVDVSPTQEEIEQQESFIGWFSIVLPIEEARKLSRELNSAEALRTKTIDDEIRVAQYNLDSAKDQVKKAKAILDDLKKKK